MHVPEYEYVFFFLVLFRSLRAQPLWHGHGARSARFWTRRAFGFSRNGANHNFPNLHCVHGRRARPPAPKSLHCPPARTPARPHALSLARPLSRPSAPPVAIMPVASAPAPKPVVPYLSRVSAACAELKPRDTASVQALSAYLAAHYGPVSKPALAAALKKGVADGALVKVKASYRLSPGAKAAAKKPAAKKAAAPTAAAPAKAKKPAAAKKVTKVKKPAAAAKPKKTIAKKKAPAKATKKTAAAKAKKPSATKAKAKKKTASKPKK